MAVRPTTQIAIAILLLAAAQTLPAQNAPASTPPPCPANTQSTAQKPCTPSSPSVQEQFPFPGESSASPASNTAAPDAPAPAHNQAAPANSAPNSDKFPFPGEADSSSSSSSSSSADQPNPDQPNPDQPSNPDTPPLKDAGSYGINTRRKLPKVQQPQSNDDRFEEDLRVARFYRDKGDFNAAYLRSKDAVKTIPDDPEAHLLLAQMAQRLNKKDEAVTEFNATLKFDPSSDQKKAVAKALRELH